jgi:uncharacterized membrane-anchored protein
MPNASLRILIVAALCVLALVGLVVREGMARAAGQEVMIAMAAIDPRALLQGHYVIIELQETLPADAPCPLSLEQGARSPRQGEQGWLALSPNEDRYSVTAIAPTREQAAQYGAITVRGDATCYKAGIIEGEPPQPGVVRADLGVSRFYINQAEAERIEAVLRAQNAGEDARVFAIVSIGDDGRARLKGLMVEGERLTLDWR